MPEPLLFLLVAIPYLLGAVALYWIIRLAVRHALKDAERQRLR
jgi:hypothetical protein